MASHAFAKMTPRRKWLAVGTGLVLLAAIIGTLLALSATRGFQGRYAAPEAGSDAPAVPVGPLPPPVGRPAPRVVAPPAPVVTPAAETGAIDDEIDDEDADRIAGAIARTTRKALRRGETVHWHKAGEEGYVSVSDLRDDGDRVCRNVTAVILTDGGETPSGSHLWCADADEQDDWAPAEEGTR